MALIHHLAAAHGIDLHLLQSLVGERITDGGYELEIQADGTFRIVAAPADHSRSIGAVITTNHVAWRTLAATAMTLAR